MDKSANSMEKSANSMEKSAYSMEKSAYSMEKLLLFKPHNMLISGVTNCGKTHFILDLLEKYYFKKFNYIVIFCPTFLK